MASFKAGLRWRLCGCVRAVLKPVLLCTLSQPWLALAVESSWPIDRLPIALHAHAIITASCHVELLSLAPTTKRHHYE